MSRYTKEQCEDIASLLAKKSPNHPAMIMVKAICKDFADLFAADNPPICLHCGQDVELGDTCPAGDGVGAPHAHTQGFDREQFLEACRLEPNN